MIIFGDIGKLSKLITSVALTSSVGEELSANRCIKVSQTAFDRTEFTSVEPGRAIFKRYFNHASIENSGGNEGTEFLVDFKSLDQNLKTFKKSQVRTLTFQLTKGVLRCRANLALVQGQRRESGNKILRQYPGSIDDFYSIDPLPSRLIATVPAESLNTIVFLLKNFGDFSAEKFEGTHNFHRPVLLTFKGSQLEGLTNYKAAYGSYLLIKQPAQVVHPLSIAIEGRLLSRLMDLSKDEPVQVFKDEDSDWVRFSGDQGEVIAMTMATPMQIARESKLLTSKDSDQYQSHRGVNIQDLYSALVMHSKDVSGRSDLLLLEEKGQLVIAPAHNITSKEYSCVPIDPFTVVGDFQPLVLSGLGAEAIVDALKKFLLRQRLPVNQVVLSQYVFSRPSGALIWMLYFSLYPLEIDPLLRENTEAVLTENYIEGLIISRGADSVDGLLDDDE